MHISEMQSKIDKMYFLVEIKALKLLLEYLDIATGILFIGSQRVNKQ